MNNIPNSKTAAGRSVHQLATNVVTTAAKHLMENYRMNKFISTRTLWRPQDNSYQNEFTEIEWKKVIKKTNIFREAIQNPT
jgi:hypothetical protein